MAPIRILIQTDSGPYASLLKEAVSSLNQEGFATLVTLREILAQNSGGPLLLLNGDYRETGQTRLAAAGVSIDFHLAVIDLGIEPDEDGCFTKDDLQLAIDGIRAVCTVTDGPTPGHHCACR